MHRFLRFSIVIYLLLICTSCSSSSTNISCPSISTPQVTKSTNTKTLTSEELSFFNSNFFNQSGSEGIRNFFLCSIYNEPQEINLYKLFYNNIFLDDLSQVEMEYIATVDTAVNDDAYSLFRITSQEVDALLVRYMGLRLSETNRIGIENLIFVPDFDAYYVVYDNVYSFPAIAFLYGEQENDFIQLYYRASDTYLSMDDETLLCVTLKEKNGEYMFISNKYVSIPSSVEAQPILSIPINTLEPYLPHQVSTQCHDNDCVHYVACKDLGAFSVCIYKANDNNIYAAVLPDKNESNIVNFYSFPIDIIGPGFAFDAFEELLGRPACSIAYETAEGRHCIVFGFSEDMVPYLLAKSDRRCYVMDLDKDGTNELIFFNNGLPKILLNVDESIYCADIELLIRANWSPEGFLRFKAPEIDKCRLPFYEEIISDDGNLQKAGTYYLYFYEQKLLIYSAII